MKLYSKSDTLFFKGVAITLIVLHNYFHWIPGFGIENELTFKTQNIFDFLSFFKSFSIVNYIGATFGLLGHYGVQIFIIFSAYGLSIQYAKHTGGSWIFILNRLKKLYFLLFFAIAISYPILALTGRIYEVKDLIIRSFLLSSSLSSFSHDFVYAIFSGPYWFFALMVQLYLLFPLLYKITLKLSKTFIGLPILLSLLIVYIVYFTIEQSPFTLLIWPTTFSTMGNILGHLPEVILGIIMAQQKVTRFSKVSLLIAFFVFIASQFTVYLFPISFLSMSILLITATNTISHISSKNFKNLMMYLGQISMILFILNGPLRRFAIFQNENIPLRAAMVFLFILILLSLSHFIFKFYNYLMKKFHI